MMPARRLSARQGSNSCLLKPGARPHRIATRLRRGRVNQPALTSAAPSDTPSSSPNPKPSGGILGAIKRFFVGDQVDKAKLAALGMGAFARWVLLHPVVPCSPQASRAPTDSLQAGQKQPPTAAASARGLPRLQTRDAPCSAAEPLSCTAQLLHSSTAQLHRHNPPGLPSACPCLQLRRHFERHLRRLCHFGMAGVRQADGPVALGARAVERCNAPRS